MTRTLHVIDQPTEVGEALILRLSVDSARDDARHNADAKHAWLLIGGEAIRDAAYAAGLDDSDFCLVPRPAGLHLLFPQANRQARERMGRARRVVCWTEGAAEIASLLGCAKVTRRCEQATLCSFAKRLIDAASDNTATIASHQRAPLRERWAVNEDSLVVALLSDHFDSVDSSAALLAMVFTHEVLRAGQSERSDVRLLCHPHAKRRIDAATLSEQLHFPDLLVQDAGLSAPWSVLAGCDVALAPDPGAAGLSLLWANAMGVPIVAPVDGRQPGLSELQQVVASRSCSPKHLAHTLTQWIQSKTFAHAE